MSTILNRSHLDSLRGYLAIADASAAETETIRSLAERMSALLDGAPLDAGDGAAPLLSSRDVEVLTALGNAGGSSLLDVRDAVFYALVVAGRRKERRQSGARRWPSRRESTTVREAEGE